MQWLVCSVERCKRRGALIYHLTQRTWCKIKQLGLVNHYNDDEDFRMFCGKLDGLSYPPTRFQKVWPT